LGGTTFMTMGALGGIGGLCIPVTRTYYYYNDDGNVTNVVTQNLSPSPGEKPFSSSWLTYAGDERTVTFSVGEEWTDETDHEIVWAREYRYDQARARYLHRVLDPDELEQGNLVGDDTWSQYDGDEIYSDYTVDGQDVTVTAWYEAGIGMVEDVSGTPMVKYYHDNLIGTTRFMTDANGNKIEEAVYTAFGEPVSGDPRRFGYAGAWGYQTDVPGDMPYMHVGHRYYDPSTGRFLQRDPIGIEGGLNVYAYVEGSPTRWIDPAGLQAAPVPAYYATNAAAVKEAVETGAMLCAIGYGASGASEVYKRKRPRIGDHKDRSIPDRPTHRPRIRPPSSKPSGDDGHPRAHSLIAVGGIVLIYIVASPIVRRREESALRRMR